MEVLFQSARLMFRQFTVNDAELVYALNSDPAVVKYLNEPVVTYQKAQQVLADIILPQYVLYNHGRWAVHLKNNQNFIGWCGLKYRPERQQVDLGYRFMKAYWGQGYATEAALRTVDYAFKILQLPKLVAAADVDNIASQKVLEKVGFSYLSNEFIDDYPVKTYELFKPQ